MVKYVSSATKAEGGKYASSEYVVDPGIRTAAQNSSSSSGGGTSQTGGGTSQTRNTGAIINETSRLAAEKGWTPEQQRLYEVRQVKEYQKAVDAGYKGNFGSFAKEFNKGEGKESGSAIASMETKQRLEQIRASAKQKRDKEKASNVKNTYFHEYHESGKMKAEVKATEEFVISQGLGLQGAQVPQATLDTLYGMSVFREQRRREIDESTKKGLFGDTKGEAGSTLYTKQLSEAESRGGTVSFLDTLASFSAPEKGYDFGYTSHNFMSPYIKDSPNEFSSEIMSPAATIGMSVRPGATVGGTTFPYGGKYTINIKDIPEKKEPFDIYRDIDEKYSEMRKSGKSIFFGERPSDDLGAFVYGAKVGLLEDPMVELTKFGLGFTQAAKYGGFLLGDSLRGELTKETESEYLRQFSQGVVVYTSFPLTLLALGKGQKYLGKFATGYFENVAKFPVMKEATSLIGSKIPFEITSKTVAGWTTSPTLVFGSIVGLNTYQRTEHIAESLGAGVGFGGAVYGVQRIGGVIKEINKKLPDDIVYNQKGILGTIKSLEQNIIKEKSLSAKEAARFMKEANPSELREALSSGARYGKYISKDIARWVISKKPGYEKYYPRVGDIIKNKAVDANKYSVKDLQEEMMKLNGIKELPQRYIVEMTGKGEFKFIKNPKFTEFSKSEEALTAIKGAKTGKPTILEFIIRGSMDKIKTTSGKYGSASKDLYLSIQKITSKYIGKKIAPYVTEYNGLKFKAENTKFRTTEPKLYESIVKQVEASKTGQKIVKQVEATKTGQNINLRIYESTKIKPFSLSLRKLQVSQLSMISKQLSLQKTQLRLETRQTQRLEQRQTQRQALRLKTRLITRQIIKKPPTTIPNILKPEEIRTISKKRKSKHYLKFKPRYQPSLFASIYGITGKVSKNISSSKQALTGLEFRPIPERRSKRGVRKRK